jgi:site-specific recombinase XerD
MSRVAFHLKRPNDTTPQSIFALYHINGKQVKIYTKISVRPQDWLKSKQRVRANAINAAPINDRLSEFSRKIEEIAFQLSRDGSLTPERLKQEFNNFIDPPPVRQLALLSLLQEWIDEATTQRRALTIRNYNTLKNHLTAFCKYRRAEPNVAAVDKGFIDEFGVYLAEKQNLINTSRWGHIKNLKTFLRWAYENDHTTQRSFERVKRSAYYVQEPMIIRLTEAELQSIAKLELPKESALENARDLFLLQCSLGVRYSDLMTIGKESIEGDMVRLTTQKNRKDVSIPLLPTARKLIEREKPLRTLSNQKLNKYLKDVAKMAGLDAMVTLPVFQGPNRHDLTYPKYELVTTHTAKRTFVSLMVAKGVTIDTIMKVTGNTRSTIERYINLTEDEVQADMLKVKDLLP